jgi:hypothetical protein
MLDARRGECRRYHSNHKVRQHTEVVGALVHECNEDVKEDVDRSRIILLRIIGQTEQLASGTIDLLFDLLAAELPSFHHDPWLGSLAHLQHVQRILVLVVRLEGREGQQDLDAPGDLRLVAARLQSSAFIQRRYLARTHLLEPVQSRNCSLPRTLDLLVCIHHDLDVLPVLFESHHGFQDAAQPELARFVASLLFNGLGAAATFYVVSVCQSRGIPRLIERYPPRWVFEAVVSSTRHEKNRARQVAAVASDKAGLGAACS